MKNKLSLHLGTFALAIAISVNAQATIANCYTTLIELSSLTLSKTQATDLRRLHAGVKAVVLMSLAGSWVEIKTFEVNPLLGRALSYQHSEDPKDRDQKVESHLVQIQSVREENVGNRKIAYIIGSTAGSVDGQAARTRIATPVEINFDNIISVRLVESPEITISLLPLYKPDGRPKLVLKNTLEDKVKTMAEGSIDATYVLSELMAAKVKDFNGKLVTFETLIKTLDSENIRGEQIEAAYLYYAWGSVDELIKGILRDPDGLIEAVNQAMKKEYEGKKPYRYIATKPQSAAQDMADNTIVQ
jgi:hypothetical protein